MRLNKVQLKSKKFICQIPGFRCSLVKLEVYRNTLAYILDLASMNLYVKVAYVNSPAIVM